MKKPDREFIRLITILDYWSAVSLKIATRLMNKLLHLIAKFDDKEY